MIRQVHSDYIAFVLPGKPTTVASVDDAINNHRMQLEVTVTKLK